MLFTKALNPVSMNVISFFYRAESVLNSSHIKRAKVQNTERHTFLRHLSSHRWSEIPPAIFRWRGLPLFPFLILKQQKRCHDFSSQLFSFQHSFCPAFVCPIWSEISPERLSFSHLNDGFNGIFIAQQSCLLRAPLWVQSTVNQGAHHGYSIGAWSLGTNSIYCVKSVSAGSF